MPQRAANTFGGIELSARTLPRLLRRRAHQHPKKVFLQVWSHTAGLQQTVTYEQLLDRVMQMRGALENLGVRHGARVALLSHNNVDYLVVGLALMALRAVPVHLNWRQPVNLLEATVKLARCRLVFASRHFWEAAQTICAANRLRPPVDLVRFGQLLVDDHDTGEIFGGGDGEDEDDGGGGSGGPAREAKEGDEMAVVFFTSGSTKTPKAVPHTHNELMWLAHQYVEQLDGGHAAEGGHDDVDGGTLCLFPFFHVMGYVHNWVYNLYRGIRVVLHAETADTAINPDLMLRAIRELRPTVVNTVPYIVEGWCQMLQDKDPAVQCVKDLRYISYGGAALPDYCRDILNAHHVNAMMSYGQTEVGAAIMFTVPHGSLEYMELLPGVTYELVADDGADVAAQDDGRTGELVLLGLYSTTKGYLPGSNARPLAPEGLTTYDRYRTGDVFEEHVMPDGKRLLAYRCRHDDLVVHKTGEMSHPVPTEQAILTDTSAFVHRLCYFGQGRTAALLAVELLPGRQPAAVAADLWRAVMRANALQPAYSAVTHHAVILVQPDVHAPLPVTNKGNVMRLRVERWFSEDLTEANPSVRTDRGVALADVLDAELLAELDEQEWDSLDFSSGAGRRTPPFMVKQFHAYFVAMVGIIAMHMCGARGQDQYAPFLVRAGVQPEFLRGLPRGAQIFALPTFIILMGIGDFRALLKPLAVRRGGAHHHGGGPAASVAATVAAHAWRDLGRPLLLFCVCKFVLPFLAGLALHPYYGGGKGGHVTFNWIFLFMVYARAATQLLVRGLRLPRWAPALLALALHFGCFPGAGFVCPAPFARSYRLVGPLPAFLNCPRFSVYYPFYAVAPLFVSEAVLLSKRLATVPARAAAACVFAALVLWAMGSFNIDTTYMAMEAYGCRSSGSDGACTAAWDWSPFVEDLGSLVLCTVASVALLVACSTTPSFASAVGQRSLVALVVHLYAIYPLNPQLQVVCRWVAVHATPIVLPALVALVLCTAVQIVSCLPFSSGGAQSSAAAQWFPRVRIVPEVRTPASVALVLVGGLSAMAVAKSL